MSNYRATRSTGRRGAPRDFVSGSSRVASAVSYQLKVSICNRWRVICTRTSVGLLSRGALGSSNRRSSARRNNSWPKKIFRARGDAVIRINYYPSGCLAVFSLVFDWASRSCTRIAESNLELFQTTDPNFPVEYYTCALRYSEELLETTEQFNRQFEIRLIHKLPSLNGGEPVSLIIPRKNRFF